MQRMHAKSRQKPRAQTPPVALATDVGVDKSRGFKPRQWRWPLMSESHSGGSSVSVFVQFPFLALECITTTVATDPTAHVATIIASLSTPR